MLRCCFFFPSRRRHTRFDCDWSSDVCSSDLMDSTLTQLPRLVASLGRARDLVADAARHKQITTEEKTRLADLAAQINDPTATLGADLKQITNFYSFVSSQLTESSKACQQAANRFLHKVN